MKTTTYLTHADHLDVARWAVASMAFDPDSGDLTTDSGWEVE